MSDYSLDELEELTGIAKRTIRFYIQKGLVEAPFGARRTPSYTSKHVEQLLLVKQFKAAGLNLSKIAESMSSGPEALTQKSVKVGEVSVISRVQIAPVIALDIDRQQSDLSEEAIRNLADAIIQHLSNNQDV